VLVIFTLAGASVARGQMTSPTMSDATVVTRGALRVRGAVNWTRIDGTFGPDGKIVLPLGANLTGSLDPVALPLLTTGEIAARILADDPTLSLTAGQLTTSVDSRIATVPITVEYGLTSRITLGAVIPIVQSRSVVTSQLNGRQDSIANVGTNPASFHNSPAAFASNFAVADGLGTASEQLAQRIADCAASPSSAGCAAINSRSAEASALVNASATFTQAVANLYGISPDFPGAAFVPLSGSAIQMAIDARLEALRAGFTSFGISGGSGSLTPAAAPAANAQLAEILRDPDFGIGLDSLGTTEQTAVGDIELSATTLLFNSFGAAAGLRLRGVAAGVVRLGTGHRARENRPYDVPTGDGQMDIEVRGAVDALFGRLLTTVAGTYTVQTGSVETTRLPALPGAFFPLDFAVAGTTKLGNMAAVRINPRFMITPALMVGALGVGSWRAGDEVTITGAAAPGAAFGNAAALTTFAGGLTISYSNLASTSGVGGQGFPAEIVFSHLETVTASAAGAAKTYRDAIELRFYLGSSR
jgi:hypothetical protein